MLYQGIIGGGSSPVEPVDLSPVLLWTNPSPTSEFASQTISLDLTEYVGVIVEFITTAGTNALGSRLYCKKTDNYGNLGAGFTSDNGHARNVLSVNNTGIEFGNALVATSQTNNSVVPIKIYGVKEYVVEPVVGDLLWTNASPNAELGRTEIPGDFSKYKSVIVKAKANTTSDYISEFNIFKSSSGYSGGMCFVGLSQANLYRIVIFTDEKITISAGSYETSGTSSDRNNVAIPLEIYGIE